MTLTLAALEHAVDLTPWREACEQLGFKTTADAWEGTLAGQSLRVCVQPASASRAWVTAATGRLRLSNALVVRVARTTPLHPQDADPVGMVVRGGVLTQEAAALARFPVSALGAYVEDRRLRLAAHGCAQLRTVHAVHDALRALARLATALEETLAPWSDDWTPAERERAVRLRKQRLSNRLGRTPHELASMVERLGRLTDPDPVHPVCLALAHSAIPPTDVHRHLNRVPSHRLVEFVAEMVDVAAVSPTPGARACLRWILDVYEANNRETTARIIDILGEYGTGVDLPTLQRFASGLLRSTRVKDAAGAAIASINQRVDVGALTVSAADAGGGDLSLSDQADPP